LKLKVTSKGTESLQQQKEMNKKLGKRSKNKGASYERSIAKRFEEAYSVKLSRTPQSGGHSKGRNPSDEFKGDIVCLEKDKIFNLGVECKCQKTWSLPAWLRQSEEETPEGKVPIVVFHQHGTSKDYVSLSLDDFLKLVPKENVLGEVSND
jgi:hypothetical protein